MSEGQRLNRAKALLAAGKPIFGLISTISGVQTTQILARAGFDWLLIDMEHGPIDVAAAHAMIVATAGTGTVPFVRVPWTHAWQAKTVMDLGALGIEFPMTCTSEDAGQLVRAVRYPPAGERLWGPFYAPLRWGRRMDQYIDEARDDILAIATIEHPKAIENIDAIVDTPGLDVAVIGPGDLAMSLGIPGEFDHPKFKSAVARAESAIANSPVALGGVARSPEEIRPMLDRGYRMLALCGFDWMLLQQASGQWLERAHASG